MKDQSVKDIEKKVNELWAAREFEWKDLNIEVRKYSPNEVHITLSCMYSPPGLTFKHLKALSEYFETDNIVDDEGFSSSGCETCDYGSKYGYTLTIKPDETEEEKKWKHIKNTKEK
jgi:hypothetical protein